jgi:hypothetical protein
MSTHPEMARPGNVLALRHGANSERQIVHRSVVEKRRLLRQIGLRQEDLESVGRALLQNWARAAAALSLMDEYASQAGWLDEDGNPRGFARLYVSMLNAERLALRELEKHIRSDGRDAASALRTYLESSDRA